MPTSPERFHQPINENERSVLELAKMEQAWEEAVDRLPSSDSNLLELTRDEKDVEVIASYLRDHESELSEEGKFFLQATIYLRKAKERLEETRPSK